MRHVIVAGIMALAACENAATDSGGGVLREYMVIGNSMTFEQCRARGGFIIRDANTPMIACDPSVRREPVPADEFDHPR